MKVNVIMIYVKYFILPFLIMVFASLNIVLKIENNVKLVLLTSLFFIKDF